MSMNKYISSILLALAACIFMPSQVQATHIVGGDMTYRCLGNDQYEITLTVRRDCENGAEDAPFDDPAYIGVFDIFGSLQVHLGELGRYEIPFMGEDTITNSIVYDCSALGTPVCVHEAVYRDTVYLPFNKIGYRLAYQRCCRNSILVNIEEPLETGATYHFSIPVNVLTECNSQPAFNSWPDVYACVNEELVMDLSATDPDGDNLLYKLCTPSQGATSDNPRPFTPSNPPYPTVIWQNPYGLTNMIGGNPPLSINSSTGEITGMPNQVGTYLIGVCVEEYRNGALLSTVRRDFEVNVRVCTDPIDMSCEINGANGDCDGNLELEFVNTSDGADSYRWLIVDSAGDTIHIETLDQFDYVFPDFGEYTIILEGTRNLDGCTARKIETVRLGNPEVSADFELALESCDSLNLIRLDDISADPSGSSVPVEWQWTIDGTVVGDTPSIVYDAGDSDELEVTLQVVYNSGCVADTTRVVNISDLFPEVDFEYVLSACDGDVYEIELSSSFEPSNQVPLEINWTVSDDTGIQNLTGEDIVVDVTGDDVTVELEILFDNGCSDTASETFNPADLIPTIELVYSVLECFGEDSISVEILPEIDPTSSIDLDSLFWTVNGVAFDSETVNIILPQGVDLDVDLIAIFDNGCVNTVSDLVPSDLLFPNIDIIYDTGGCIGEGEDSEIEINVINNSIANGYEIDSIAWIINGVLYNSETLVLEVTGGDSLAVSVFVLFVNGCIAELDDTIVIGADGGLVDFVAGFVNCDSTNIISFEDITATLGNGNPVSWLWTVNGMFAGDTESILYDAGSSSELEVTLEVTFADSCTAMETKLIDRNDLFPTAEFEYELIQCLDDGFEVRLSAEYQPDHYIPFSIDWTIIDETGSTDYTGQTITVQIVGESAQVNLGILFENNCIAFKREDIFPSEQVPQIGTEYTVLECIGEDSLSVLLEPGIGVNDTLEIESIFWIINGDTITTESIDLLLAYTDSLDVVLEVNYVNGCGSRFEESLLAEDLFPELDLGFSFGDCPVDGDSTSVKLWPELIGVTNGFGIDSISWTIDGVSYELDTVMLDVIGGDTLDVSLFVLYENGCQSSLDEDFVVSFDGQLNIIEEVLCVDGIQPTVFLYDSTGLDVSSYEWILNGTDVISDSSSAEFILIGDGVTVDLNVIFDNGCEASYSQVFNQSLYDPELNASIEIDSCYADSVDISINYDLGLEIEFDSLIINGVEYDSLPVVISVPYDSLVFLEYYVDYANGCSASEVRSFLPSDVQVEPSFDTELLDCRDSSILFSIISTTAYNGEFETEWTILEGDSTYTFTGNQIDSLEMFGDSIIVIQDVWLDNGCFITDTTGLSQDDIIPDIELPELEYTVELLECVGDSGVFVFTDLTEAPECLYITDRIWIIDNQVCEGNPVIKTLGLGEEIPFILTLTFNDGQVLSTSLDTILTNDFIDPNDYIDTSGIEVASNNPGFCNDSISLYVVNPDSAISYEWASDIGFIDILGTGPTLDTVAWPGFEGIIYIQTVGFSGPCEYGLDSIEVDFKDIDLGIDSTYTVCAGDTSNFMIVNNDPEQILEYVWKDDQGVIIEGDSTANPLIGIPSDSIDDFFLVLCTSNQFGCMSTDTINFNIGTRDTLQEFTYTIDSCGSLTVHFDEAPNMLGDAAIWDFGDGNGATGSTPSHTYDLPGQYTVTLSDSTEFCPSEPVSLDITVGMLDIEIVGPDTVYYDSGTTVTLTAETNGVPDSISWCTEDGMNIGSGPVLQDFDPMMDTVLVIAKIVDMFGCSDRDSVLLIPEMDPDECLDSLRIDGPQDGVICEGEEFVLCLIFDDECDPDDFSFLWNPEECIIEGQGTPKITGFAEESKTIMVLVTHIATGIDSIYSFDITVNIPDPQISVPEINLDENNNAFVCLGQSIILSVEPEDSNCEYTWSDGSTGGSIELFPEEDFSIWVECIDTFGCVGVSDTLDVSVVPPQCDESDVFIPNAFSPNGDNVNDVLFVRSKFIDEMELVIVNRWGQVVFTSTDQSVGWDGSYNGESLAPDAFSYTLSVLCIDGQSYVKTGNVSIVK